MDHASFHVSEILNTLKFALHNKGWKVVGQKIIAKMSSFADARERAEVLKWCQSVAEPYAVWAERASPELWSEASKFGEDLTARATRELPNAKTRFGGGGAYALLYFMVRLRRPTVVVETGVAAGWSSTAILAALEANGHGELWSSDLPYFRQGAQVGEIGVLVPEELKGRWHLYIEGDRINLPQIVDKVPSIDLFHYDSDKTKAGRDFALSIVGPRLSDDATVLFDDILDNDHFRGLAGPDKRVLSDHRRFVGMLSHGRPATTA